MSGKAAAPGMRQASRRPLPATCPGTGGRRFLASPAKFALRATGRRFIAPPRWRMDRGIRAAGADPRFGPPVPLPQGPVRQWSQSPPSCSSRSVPRGVIRLAASGEGGGQCHYCNVFQMDTRSNGAFEFAANLFRAFSFGQSSIVIRCEPHQEGSSRTAHAKVGRVKLECRFLNRASTCPGCTTILDVPGQRASFSRESIVFGSGRITKVPAESHLRKWSFGRQECRLRTRPATSRKGGAARHTVDRKRSTGTPAKLRSHRADRSRAAVPGEGCRVLDGSEREDGREPAFDNLRFGRRAPRRARRSSAMRASTAAPRSSSATWPMPGARGQDVPGMPAGQGRPGSASGSRVGRPFRRVRFLAVSRCEAKRVGSGRDEVPVRDDALSQPVRSKGRHSDDQPMIGRRNDEHVLTTKFQHPSPPEIPHVSRDQEVSLSCIRCQQDVTVIVDLTKHPSRFVQHGCGQALFEETTDALAKVGGASPASDQDSRARRHAQDQVPVLASRALQRGKHGSGD